MNSKALLILIISILFMLGAQWWYGNNTPGCCDNEVKENIIPSTTPTTPVEKDPLMFKWSDATPLTYDKFDLFKKGILNGDKQDNTLVIKGKYYDGEAAPKGYENMGIARAAETRKLFSEIPDTRIKLLSEKVAKKAGIENKEFTSANLIWEAASKEEKMLIELANKALIYFPYNSTKKELDPSVDEYLKRLATRLTSGTEKVIITGHTDDRGDEVANMKLGERRAKTVRDILVKLGVPQDRITTLSKGETEPAEPNGTERGWRMNRRTEVEVVQ